MTIMPLPQSHVDVTHFPSGHVACLEHNSVIATLALRSHFLVHVSPIHIWYMLYWGPYDGHALTELVTLIFETCQVLLEEAFGLSIFSCLLHLVSAWDLPKLWDPVSH